jgi:fatty-acyl-CoA synthase
MYSHPAVHEACVVAVQDARRGEAVKAILVIKPDHRGITEADIIAWCREQMAAYKVPSAVEFVAALPKSSTGKILWREMQEKEALALKPGGSSAYANANCDAAAHR